ncbi:MAG: hypothetical protein EA369_04635 [Bradymonadales bacterium]|nr:MAG: hypothetical protein EA369_04635 [Bradymonadales bacterium]
MLSKFQISRFHPLCLSLSIAFFTQVQLSIASIDGINALWERIEDQGIESIEELLDDPLFSRTFGRSFLLIHDSRSSLQHASRDDPRVVLYNRKPNHQRMNMMIAMSSREQLKGGNSLEIIDFQFDSADFQFARIEFEPSGTFLTLDPPECAQCHQGRPVWDSYRFWPGVFPEHSLRENRYLRAMEHYERHAASTRLGLLKTPDGKPAFSDDPIYISGLLRSIEDFSTDVGYLNMWKLMGSLQQELTSEELRWFFELLEGGPRLLKREQGGGWLSRAFPNWDAEQTLKHYESLLLDTQEGLQRYLERRRSRWKGLTGERWLKEYEVITPLGGTGPTREFDTGNIGNIALIRLFLRYRGLEYLFQPLTLEKDSWAFSAPRLRSQPQSESCRELLRKIKRRQRKN